MTLKCRIDGCSRNARKRGWCQVHYMRWYHHGSAEAQIRTGRALQDRILDLSIAEPNSGCWLWTGAYRRNGYGKIRIGSTRREVTASRASWMAFNGDIPAGQSICHKCDTPACVNPSHLFPGSQTDNIRDASRKKRLNNANAAKTHCPKGHPYAGTNLSIGITGGRICKECRRVKEAIRRQERCNMGDLECRSV